MILSCNSCEKKFVVPDHAITATGRLVQCSSCGNKWKQFPVENKAKAGISNQTNINKKVIPHAKTKKKKRKEKVKKREVSLYSPEYLAQKHGINLSKSKSTETSNINKVSFGFYNSIIIFIFFLIVFSRGLFFFQDLIIEKFPITEFYLNYFFENIRNIFEIIKDLILNY